MSGPVVERQVVDAGDGLRLHVERGGGGPPLLFLHGFTGSAETWTPLRTALGARYATIAVDLPGHGRSSAPADPARYALPRLADDLARVLDALAAERVMLLGYSMGGRAALQFALRHGDRLAGLILESTSPGITDPARRAQRVAADRALADDIEREGVRAFVDRWERLPLWESQRTLPEEGRARLRAQREANDARGLANSLRGAGTGVDEPVLPRLPGVGAPTLLVAGERDPAYVAHAREMARALPSARVLVLPKAGHAVHLEQPKSLAAALGAFLAVVPSAAGRWR